MVRYEGQAFYPMYRLSSISQFSITAESPGSLADAVWGMGYWPATGTSDDLLVPCFDMEAIRSAPIHRQGSICSTIGIDVNIPPPPDEPSHRGHTTPVGICCT
ncbi:unnamed protein product [Macrosiphum euphorbiae]|uniref:Uncharacterized protein n=1 Tax=Macrosiphum euphorbiae TaxID=13131 RepID=A0AAV0Y2A4_9HEMI|nr:unnamed protein product [Macrosiphum euphorbiae]CAI6374940.1 unnamed protein product [Macrosiphum euphorbiae]